MRVYIFKCINNLKDLTMHFLYFLLLTLNEIIKTSAATSSSKIDAVASSSNVDAEAISSEDRELIKCPMVHFTKKLQHYNKEEEKIFHKECVNACSGNKRHHGIWYKNKKGKKEAICWTRFRYGTTFEYDATTETCECGMYIPTRLATRPCIPRMQIRGISSSELCENECEEKKFHLYQSQTRTHTMSFCYVKDVYKYPNLVGKSFFIKYYNELKCHCAVEDLPANALSAIEDRRKYAYPVNDHYFPEELSAIVEALKTGRIENLSIVLSNLSSSAGNSSRPISGSLAGVIPELSVDMDQGSSVKLSGQASLGSVHPGISSKVLPTDRSRRENPDASSSTIFVSPTRASRENLRQLSLAPLSTRVTQSDRVELLACPNSYFTRKLTPYNKDEELLFNEECKKACSENTSYHGIWYTNKYRKKEAACWNTFRYGVGFHYDEATQMCECRMHLNTQRDKPCKPKMIIRGISSSELCDDECEEKKFHVYKSRKRTYSLGFCYVKDGYNYPNLVGKPTYDISSVGQELNCHCAVEDLPANALSAIEDRWVYIRPHNKDYSPEELEAIVEALETGMSENLSNVLSNLRASPGNSSRPVEMLPRSPVKAFPSIFLRGNVQNTARPYSKSTAIANKGSKKRVTSSKFPGNTSGTTRNETAGREQTNHSIGPFSQTSLDGVCPNTSAEVIPKDISRREITHASSKNIFIAPINASTKNLAQHPQLSLAPPSTLTNAIPHYLGKPVPRRFAEFPTFFNTTFFSSTSETPSSDNIPPRTSLSLFPITVPPTTEIISGKNHATPIQDNTESQDTMLSLGGIYERQESSTSPLSKKPRGGTK